MQFWLSKRAGVPLPDQLSAQIRLAIASGELQPGDALPSVRMAAHLHCVHRNTICSAYGELRRLGWLTSGRGQRMFVAHGNSTHSAPMCVSPVLACVADPDLELAEIIALEVRERAGISATTEAHRVKAKREIGQTLVVLAAGRRLDTAYADDVLSLSTTSLHSVLRGAPRLSRSKLVLVLSRSRTVLDRVRILMTALGVDLEAVHFRDAKRPDWDRGLAQMDLVVCDRVAAQCVPSQKRTFVLDIIAENSIAVAQARLASRPDNSLMEKFSKQSSGHKA